MHGLLCAQNASDHGRYHAPQPPILSQNASDQYHVAMDALFEPWVLCAQNALDHGRYHARPPPPNHPHGVRMHQAIVSWSGHGCSVEHWVLRAQNALDHGHYHAPPNPPLESKCIRPWYHCGHGCSVLVLRMHQTMDVTMPPFPTPHPMAPR